MRVSGSPAGEVSVVDLLKLSKDAVGFTAYKKGGRKTNKLVTEEAGIHQAAARGGCGSDSHHAMAFLGD